MIMAEKIEAGNELDRRAVIAYKAMNSAFVVGIVLGIISLVLLILI